MRNARKPAPRTVRGYNAAALKDARKAAGMTQAEVAKAAGIARPNYVNFENGKREPGTNLLGRFAKAVGVETRDLVRLDPKKTILRDLRQLAGIGRSEVTDKLGFKSVTSYADMESGRTKPTSAQIGILAELFGVSVEQAEQASERRRDS